MCITKQQRWNYFLVKGTMAKEERDKWKFSGLDLPLPTPNLLLLQKYATSPLPLPPTHQEKMPWIPMGVKSPHPIIKNNKTTQLKKKKSSKAIVYQQLLPCRYVFNSIYYYTHSVRRGGRPFFKGSRQIDTTRLGSCNSLPHTIPYIRMGGIEVENLGRAMSSRQAVGADIQIHFLEPMKHSM